MSHDHDLNVSLLRLIRGTKISRLSSNFLGAAGATRFSSDSVNSEFPVSSVFWLVLCFNPIIEFPEINRHFLRGKRRCVNKCVIITCVGISPCAQRLLLLASNVALVSIHMEQGPTSLSTCDGPLL